MAPPDSAVAAGVDTPLACWRANAGGSIAARALPLVEESPPVERRLRVIARDLVRSVRGSMKYSAYLVTNSPKWWWQRVKRLFWPFVFAAAALFFDAGLIVAWKNEGARVLATYVPMMLYVYARLFVSRGAGILSRLGVVAALVYGLWRHDLIADGGWSAIGVRRLDDLVVIAVAVRLFVASCPQDLVEYYAQQAIAMRNRITRTAPTGAP